ncbi:hypothetical protein CHS0354_027283 [Potamilus streckersoni]|uniref:Uncharacterized protein n=1 Tax=Potamilus streckersoni TaxID=2493646 RepID=A0AAE0T898_9BIVA|nr:hypothetical protein CHS0354_027283 [Potamilus streckersoni]
MGVHGLWQLLNSTGRPVPLESLENKVLAVDVSVWLHQLAKGMRDREGNPLPNAHLQGLFTRICKLLYYRIKPIFVFDGGVPELKKQTLRARRERREFAEQESGQATRKLLTNLIRSQAISHVLGEGEGSIPVTSVLKLSSSKKPDMFELPPIPESSRSYMEGGDTGNESPEDSWEERMMTRQLLEEEFQDLDAVDIHSDDFKSLPPEIQHEIIIDLKEKGKRPSRRGEVKLPKDSMDFSKYQITKLLKQSKLSNRLDEVRKELSTRSAGELTQDLEKDFFSDEVQSSRVVSSDTSHYILIKGLRRKDELKTDEENEFSENVRASAEEIQSSSSQIVDKVLNDGNVTKSKTGFRQESITGQVERESSVSNNTEFSVTEVIQTNLSKSIDNKKEGKEETVTRKELSACNKYNDPSGENFLELKHLNTADLNSRSSSKYNLFSQIASSSNSSALVHEAKVTFDINQLDSEKERFEITDDIVDLSVKEENTDEIKTVSREEVIKKDHHVEEDQSGSEDEFIEVPEFPTLINEDGSSISRNMPCIESADHAENSKGVLTAVNIENSSKDILAIDLTGVGNILEGEDAKETEVSEVINESENIDTSDSSTSESKHMIEKFQVMNKMDLHELQYDLELESTALKAERGRQERLATSITDQMHAEAQELLRLFGIPYLVSPLEAEAQCAQLDRAGHTNGTITDDSDIWLFGGHRVYKNLFQQKKHVEFYTDTNIKAQLGLTRQHLINIALLCGSDYTEGIQGVGPITAMEILAEFPGEELEGLVALK